VSIYRSYDFAFSSQATRCVHCGIDKRWCQRGPGSVRPVPQYSARERRAAGQGECCNSMAGNSGIGRVLKSGVLQ